MDIINGKKKLNPEVFGNFMNACKDDETVIIFWTKEDGTDESRECKKSEVLDYVFNSNFDKMFSREQTVALSCNSAVLEVLGADIEYWDEKYKTRHNRMGKAIDFYQKRLQKKEAASQKVPEQYYRDIAVATLGDDGNLTDFEHCVITTNNEDVLSKMNEWLVKYGLAADRGTIRFDLAYVDGHERDLSFWKSVDDLVKEGTAVLA